MTTQQYTSPNFEDRAGAETGRVKPSMLILHYTGMVTETLALDRLCDPQSKVSAHYFVRENGEVIQLVDDSKRAWHAGASYWGGVTDINSHSIGIEIANPGHEFGYRAFPAVQIQSVMTLCKALVKKYRIAPHHVLGHSDVAPARKEDPGELFPWRELAAQGVGVWPEPSAMDIEAAKEISDLSELLAAYGYDPAADTGAVIRAFHRHFAQEKFAPGADPAQPDSSTIARLLALLRAAHSHET